MLEYSCWFDGVLTEFVVGIIITKLLLLLLLLSPFIISVLVKLKSFLEVTLKSALFTSRLEIEFLTCVSIEALSKPEPLGSMFIVKPEDTLLLLLN